MPFPAGTQRGFWRGGDRHSQDKILCRDQADTLLDMSGMGGNPHERDAEEPFRNDFGNL
jgi:hypothetical protein